MAEKKYMSTAATTALWAKVKALIPDPDTFIVTFTSTNDVISADKNYNDIIAAKNAGKVVLGIYNGYPYLLSEINVDRYTQIEFYSPLSRAASELSPLARSIYMLNNTCSYYEYSLAQFASDEEVLNMLSECGLASPISDTDGDLYEDANGNIFMG